MFYIIRIVFVILVTVVLLLGLIAFLKKQVKKRKTLSKKYKVTTVIIVVALFLAAELLCFIPFEASFLRFDSIEDSLEYKWINSDDFTIHEENDFAFAVKGVFDLYSFEKINDKYSLVNYHSKINRYKMPDDSSYNSGIRNLYSAYNKTANKTFYLLNISPREYQDGIVICNELNFEYFAQPKITRGMFGYTPILGTLYQVYAITDGEPVDVIHVEMNGQTKTFQK